MPGAVDECVHCGNGRCGDCPHRPCMLPHSAISQNSDIAAQVCRCELDEHLTAQRQAQPGYVGPSFPTIAGCNGNGAIIHYRAQVGMHCGSCAR